MTLPVCAWHDDPQPDIFLRLRRWQLIYPYPRNDVIDSEKTPRTFRALFVENEYLRLTVLPELGSHLYSAYDKINRREVFHRCSEIKPGPLGRRGAWAPVGVEFNFPSAHSPSTLSPIDAVLRRSSDGSASIVLGDFERISRMRWSVALTLRPGVNVLEADVTLHNRTDLEQGYYYWSNAAVAAAEGIRYVLPITTTEGHGVGAKNDNWPIRNGVDMSWHRNIRATIGVFASGCREDFFGAYDVTSDWGVAHVADYRVLPGKKIFDWGMGPAGIRKSSEFSPPDGPYLELQAGLFEGQPSYDLLGPHRVVRFTEFWLPVHALKGPFSRANAEAAVALEAEPGRAVHVAVNVVRRRAGCRVTLRRRGREVFGVTRDLAPDRPFAAQVNVRRRADEPMELEVVDPRAGTLIRHAIGVAATREKPARSWLADPANPAETENGNGQGTNGTADKTDKAYARARSFDKMLLADHARRHYEDVLRKDPGHAPARLGLGVLMLRAGDCAKAIEHFERALARNGDLIETRYPLGLARAAMGDDARAEDEFHVALRGHYDEPSCRAQLGLCAMRAGRFLEAADEFRAALTVLPLDTRIAGFLSMALRRTSDPKDALSLVEILLSEFPTDYLMLSEAALALRQSGQARKARNAEDNLGAVLGGNAEAWIELAADYEAAGRHDEALDVLGRGIRATSTKSYTYPLLDYHAAMCLEKLGRGREAATHRRHARRMAPELCFPGRLEDMAALEQALKAAPSRRSDGGSGPDPVAAFCLGLLYYARTRRDEAIALWRRALPSMKRSKLLCTVLALSSWELNKHRETAYWLHQASRLDPENVRLTLWLDSVLAEVRHHALRHRLLRKAFAAHPDNDGVRERFASLLFDMGKPQEALDAVRGCRFKTRHGIYTLTQMHVNAHTMLAERAVARRRFAKALEYLETAGRIPIELGEDETRLEFFGKVHYLRGTCLENLGRRREAEECYRQCVGENRPYLPELLYYDHLSYQRLGKPRQSRRALDKLDKTVERLSKSVDTRQVYVHYLKSLQLLARGRRREAQNELRHARRLGWRPSSELNIWNRFGFS